MTGDTVIVAGSTLTADGPPVTIAGTPLSLATGPSGLYVFGQGSGSPSALKVAGESVSLDSAGQLIVETSTVAPATGHGGGLGSMIMGGFGPASSTAQPMEMSRLNP